MPGKLDLCGWLVEALRAMGGKASTVSVCEYVWAKHESDLRRSGELFFTWQYDIRWAATQLRKERVLRSVELSPKGIWELREPSRS